MLRTQYAPGKAYSEFLIQDNIFIFSSTRWKRGPDGNIEKNQISQKPILEFVSIQRKDVKEWAIPGLMMIMLTMNTFI